MSTDWQESCRRIRAVVTDIDGVLTDGGIGYGIGSPDEIKFFNVKDGTGFRLAHYAGLVTAAITGRASKANRQRLKELAFDFVREGCTSKGQGLVDLCRDISAAHPEQEPLLPEHCLYLGDDLIDVPAFELCGLAVAVADADDYARRHADWVTRLPGGHGAAREAIERLLRERGDYDRAVQAYLSRGSKTTNRDSIQ